MKKILSERFTYLNSIIFKILKPFSKHNIKQDCDIKIKSLNQQYNIDNKKKKNYHEEQEIWISMNKTLLRIMTSILCKSFLNYRETCIMWPGKYY